jgi:hypothetical protein
MSTDEAFSSVLLAKDFEEGLDLTHTWALTSIESFIAGDGIVSTTPNGLLVRASGNWDAADWAIAPVDHDCGHACAPVPVRPSACAPLRTRLQEPTQMVGPTLPRPGGIGLLCCRTQSRAQSLTVRPVDDGEQNGTSGGS